MKDKIGGGNIIKLTDYIVDFLINSGIEYMYIFTGGAISHLVDSVFRRNIGTGGIKPVCVRHEQAGAMAIDGYTRATGKIAAMAATSGPGATNLITGIACSYYDSIPGLYFTGQVRTWEYKGKSKQRQVGFQETDIVSVVKPLTKYAVMVMDPQDIRYELEKALWLAKSGRPGPVLIDLPMDVQWAQIDPEGLRGYKPVVKYPKSPKQVSKKIKIVAGWIRSSKHPMIISGGGVRNASAVNELRSFVTKYKIPVCVTFNGVDSFVHNSPLYSGLIGTMGNRGTNISLGRSDLVLAIGTRLSLQQVKKKPDEFVPNAILVHVDIDPNELKQRVPTDLAIACDVKVFLNYLLDELKNNGTPNFAGWVKETRDRFKQNPFCKPEYYSEKNSVNPYVFFKELSKQMDDNDILIADAGQNVMWAIQTVEIKAQQRLFTDAAHSTMGYSLPAAIGVTMHYRNGSPHVICTIGDGAIQLNIQELETIHQYNLPVKIFVMDNHSYGAIMDYQDAALDGRYFASSPDYGCSLPDFLSIARAYKIPTAEINSHDGLSEKVQSVLNSKGPIFCVVNMEPRTHVTLDI